MIYVLIVVSILTKTSPTFVPQSTVVLSEVGGLEECKAQGVASKVRDGVSFVEDYYGRTTVRTTYALCVPGRVPPLRGTVRELGPQPTRLAFDAAVPATGQEWAWDRKMRETREKLRTRSGCADVIREPIGGGRELVIEGAARVDGSLEKEGDSLTLFVVPCPPGRR